MLGIAMTLNVASTLRQHRWIVLLSLVFVLFGALRLNDISLYTDSTRYIIWGTSFAHAKGLVDETQPDPERYVVNAPFFAILLSPALLFFPYSLLAGKVWTLLWGVGFIAAFYGLLLRFFNKTTATVCILPFVFNPLVVLLSTEVMSETAFLTFVALGFLTLERLESGGHSEKRDLLVLLAVTSLIVLLREVSIALVGSITLYFLVTKQYKRALYVLGGFAVFFGAWLFRNLVLVGAPPASQATNINFVFQHFVTPPQAPLLQEFGLRILNNAAGYAVHIGGLLFYPLPEVMIFEPTGLFLGYFKGIVGAKYIIVVLFLPLLFLGIWRDISDRRTGFARLLFVLGYLLIILVYPVHDVRFLLPAFPFMIFYVAVAFSWIRDRWLRDKPRAVTYTAVLCAGLIVFPNLICMFELERSNLRYVANPLGLYEHLQETGLVKNMFTKPWNLLGQTIREHTPEGSIIAGATKEIAIFIGDRKLLELNNGVPLTTFEQYLREYVADYVMSTNVWDYYMSYEFQMAESQRFWFEPVSRIAGMRLYKIHPTYITPKEVWLATKRISIDTISANGLLRKGRVEILRAQYKEAIASLQRARQLNPGQPMATYQLTIAYTMNGQLSDASEELQRLFTYGPSTNYTQIASKHLAVATAQEQAELSDNPVQRSLVTFDAATFYWNLGYYTAAYSTVRGLLAQNPTFFAGLLWGWHYAIQRGDTVQARIYLRQLKEIDGTNPVVHQFAQIEQTQDSLRHTSDPLLRSKLHLAIARSYKSVDLPDEAIDHAQLALRENPRNADAWLYQAQVFEERNAPRAARSAYQHVLEIDPADTTARAKLAILR